MAQPTRSLIHQARCINCRVYYSEGGRRLGRADLGPISPPTNGRSTPCCTTSSSQNREDRKDGGTSTSPTSTSQLSAQDSPRSEPPDKHPQGCPPSQEPSNLCPSSPERKSPKSPYKKPPAENGWPHTPVLYHQTRRVQTQGLNSFLT